ncbi:MAG: type VI secretion system contractile sheath large subunit [Nitrospirota bacterium]|jgi:type VI secretion system ImpC/EvpB family protein/type VI secretion system ImpB/VipA family protein
MEAIERPVLRVVVVGDLVPKAEYRSGGKPPRAVVPVDKEDLDEVVGRFVGTLRLPVANRIATAPREIEVTLPVTGLKSLRPEVVAEAIPQIADLARLRSLVGELASRRLTVEQFEARAAEEIGDAHLLDQIRRAFGGTAERPVAKAAPPPTAPSAGDSGVDAILGLVDLPEGVVAGEGRPAAATPAATPSPLDEVLSQITRNRQRAADPAVARTVAEDLDRRIAAQLDEVFAHPVFRRLEVTWRGIAFLVRRADLREPIRIECLHAPRATLAAVVRSEVVGPSLRGEVAVDPGLIIVDHAFDATVPDLEELETLAALGEEAQAPVVTNVDHTFFQVQDAAEFDAISSLDLHLGRDAFIKWRALRAKEVSRWLAVAYNRFALRAPYGDEQSPTRGFAYCEGRDAGVVALWGGAAWLVAVAACHSFAATGWAGRLDGEIDALPLVGPLDRASAVEAAIGSDDLITLASHGITAPAAYPGRDRVRLAGVPTVYLAPHTQDEAENATARARAALGYQLVVAQLARCLYDLVPRCGADRPDTAIETEARRFLSALLGVRAGDDGVQVSVGPHPDRVDRRLLAVEVHPPAVVLASRAPIVMAVPIPG